MYWLIENIEQLKVLENSSFKDYFIHIIPFNNDIHPSQNNVSLVYLRPLTASKGFMLCLTHSETFSLEPDNVYKLLQKSENLYTIDKKQTLHYYPISKLQDICIPPNPYILPSNTTYDFYYSKHKEISDLNTIIPISKHYEYCEEIFETNKDKCVPQTSKYQKFFNNNVSVVFAALERKGMRVDPNIFEEYFHKIEGEYTYTNFNLKTTTTRPSNSFKGVNYVALNKTNGCRTSFIPRNDYLIEFDVVAMHPHIVAYLMGYTLPCEDIYKDFSNYCGENRNISKILMFKQLYGSIYSKYKEYPFFKEISKFIEKIWIEYNSEKGVFNPISGFNISYITHPQLSKNKLFNYLIQSTESAMFTNILYYILKNTIKMESEIILYTYDSFLCDIKEEEEVFINSLISNAFKHYNLSFTINKGVDYHNLVSP